MDQQKEALASAGVTKVFSDVMSGARDYRPGLAALVEYVREGDTVVVWKLDRLGRNMLHIQQTVKELTTSSNKPMSLSQRTVQICAVVVLQSHLWPVAGTG